MHSKTLITFEIFWMIFGKHKCQVKMMTFVSHARMAAPPCYPFELSPLNEAYELSHCHHSI